MSHRPTWPDLSPTAATRGVEDGWIARAKIRPGTTLATSSSFMEREEIEDLKEKELLKLTVDLLVVALDSEVRKFCVWLRETGSSLLLNDSSILIDSRGTEFSSAGASSRGTNLEKKGVSILS